VRIVTYNIHKGRGMDGHVSLPRIVDVLSALDADIIALQEVFAAGGSHQGQVGKAGQVETIAEKLDMRQAFGFTRHHHGRPYGNAILSRWPILESQDMDLSWAHREKRGCIRADLKTPHGTLHVYNIHMGTRYFERRHQVRSLFASKELHEHLAGPRVLVGDFNEWIKGLTTRMLSEKFESLNLKLHIGKRRSYPGLVPFLHLDQIYFERPLYVESAELVRTRLATMASDHLPLLATFGWPVE
jgi:endonuclease/exonuclease/phosphatase family metal-dependent hydrolase